MDRVEFTSTVATIKSVLCAIILACCVTAARAGDVTVTIDDTRVTHTVSDRFGGTNLVSMWNPNGINNGSAAAFKNMEMKLLRFPGGVPAHWYNWKEPLATGFTNMTPEMAWKFADYGGAEMILQTNTAQDVQKKSKKGTPYTLTSNADHQAGWVKAAKQEGIKVAFWEIGNEPENDAPAGIKGNDDRVYKWYNAKFAEQAKAIKAVDKDAKIMGPASTNEYFWWKMNDLDKFLSAHGNKHGTGLVDAISLHYYPDAGEAKNWAKKRAIPQEWVKRMDYIRSIIAKNDSRDLPVYLTEWNFAAGDKNLSSEQISTALGCADMVGMFLRTGVAGHTHFCFQHIKKNWGVLASQGDAKPENAPSPTYFALAMTNLLGSSVLESRCSAEEGNTLSAYATRSGDQSIRVMLINKSAEKQSVQINLGHAPGATATVYTLAGASGGIENTEVVYNGARSPSAVDALPKPALLKIEKGLTIPMTPYSMTVVVLGGKIE